MGLVLGRRLHGGAVLASALALITATRAARAGEPCPADAVIARTYGTSSLGRVRRLIAYIESRDLIVCRTDLSGRRSITIPRLGWTTAPAEAA